MNFGVCGEEGSGKTFLAIKILRKEYCRFVDRVASNILLRYLKIEPEYYSGIDYFEHFENGLFFCDELHRYVDCRNYDSFPDWLKSKITQGRKDNCDFLYTVQVLKDIDIKIRRRTGRLIYCKRKFAIYKDFPFFGRYYPKRKVFIQWTRTYEIDINNSRFGDVDQGIPDEVLIIHKGNLFIFGWGKKYYDSDYKIEPAPVVKVWDFGNQEKKSYLLSRFNQEIKQKSPLEMEKILSIKK